MPNPNIARALLFVAATTATAWAQSGRAELSGTVRDPSGLAVSAVAVEARENGTGAVRRATTDQSGEFHFLALTPGEYALTAAKDGFERLHRIGI